ncbi:hypothetical protein [Shewanella fidelis]|uniref:Uncharacterized protein n=1 Tax=Shewanella fidelis TaxID=173509 RepID=A0AAW8NL03_9GAMM|nr:hypothetical protein [Shewanella fidelis]MDR8523537.1 hypothetical protein [Shewanella fidelis]MDW4810084.1 hypothetical protein [Shewanella fidelis]MDW4814229.1 hypothetical protein [Shewanella fidelis]MDW4822260.1 hypothetical protein [Shewanella fidelis]MDW4826351.1 hypothetical protein [Shewanella fidelis]
MTVSAQSAVIFDFKPNCISENLGFINLTSDETEPSDPQDSKINPSLQLALAKLEQDARNKGADAVIINSVSHHRTNDGKKSKQRTKLKAQAFKMCADDVSLSSIAAPYNAKGYQVLRYSYEISYNPDDFKTKSAHNLAKSIILPKEDISIVTGVYGVELGSHITDTVQKLGPPSIEISLNDNQVLYGYGRELWFTFNNETLSHVTSKQNILNAAGLNILGFRPGFDDTLWKVDGLAQQKSDITTVKSTITSSFVQKTKNELLISSGNKNLTLNFEEFDSTDSFNKQLLLTHFTLANTSPHLLNSPQLLTQQQKSWLFDKLSPTKPEKFTLNELKQHIPFPHKVNIASDDGTWWLLGNHILIKFEQQVAKQVKISESLFVDSNEQSFLSSINSLEIPLSKAEMLIQFSEAIDNFDIVDVETTEYTIQAKYDSYEDDGVLYELEISYF